MQLLWNSSPESVLKQAMPRAPPVSGQQLACSSTLLCRVQLWLGPRPGCDHKSVLASPQLLERLHVQLSPGANSSCDGQPALPAGCVQNRLPFAGPLPPLGTLSPMGATPKRARVNLPRTVDTLRANLKTKLPPPITSSPRSQPGQQVHKPIAVAAPELQPFAASMQPLRLPAFKLAACLAECANHRLRVLPGSSKVACSQ